MVVVVVGLVCVVVVVVSLLLVLILKGVMLLVLVLLACLGGLCLGLVRRGRRRRGLRGDRGRRSRNGRHCVDVGGRVLLWFPFPSLNSFLLHSHWPRNL